MLKKVKLNINNLNDIITIPFDIGDTVNVLGQNDVLNTEIINPVLIEQINEIVDYEKIRFKPIHNNNLINRLVFKLYKRDKVENNWIDFEYTENDIKRRANAFRRSFLRLSFFDKLILSKQIRLFENTLYLDNETLYTEGINIKDAIVVREKKQINETNIISRDIEGFYLYYYKDLVLDGLTVYCKAELNNAKTGKTIKLMRNSEPISYNQFQDKIHIKVKLSYDTTHGMVYEFLDDNIEYDSNTATLIINLYENNII